MEMPLFSVRLFDIRESWVDNRVISGDLGDGVNHVVKPNWIFLIWRINLRRPDPLLIFRKNSMRAIGCCPMSY